MKISNRTDFLNTMLKEIIHKALLNIIKKANQLNMKSKFLYMKILKEINRIEVIQELEDLRTVKYIKEITYSKITKEVEKLSKSEFQRIKNENRNDLKATKPILELSSEIEIITEPHNNKIEIFADTLEAHNNNDSGFHESNGYDEHMNFCEYLDCHSDSSLYMNSLNVYERDVENFDNEVFIMNSLSDLRLDSRSSINGSCKIEDDPEKNDDAIYKSANEIIDSNSNNRLYKKSYECEKSCLIEDCYRSSLQSNNWNRIKNSDDKSFEKICQEDIIQDINIRESKIFNSLAQNTGNLAFGSIPKDILNRSIDLSVLLRDNNFGSTLNSSINAPISIVTSSVKKRKSLKNYMPGYKTAAYTILQILNQYNGANRHFILQIAKKISNTENDESQYAAGFKSLEKNEIVLIESDHKYFLTEKGKNICLKLFLHDEIIKNNEGCLLIIDSREKKSSKDRNYFQSYFNSKNIPNETRYLSLGDFIWINNEKICKYIVERKQCTDFISSIFDGRYREQKNRLKRFKNMKVIYLIENIRYEEVKEILVYRCLLETRMDGFILLETENITETTLVIESIDKTIRDECTSQDIAISYGSFLEDGNKNNYSVGEMFMVALLGAKGLSRDFCRVLFDRFGTLSNFKKNLNAETLKTIRFNEKHLSDKLISKIINLFK